MPPDDFLTLVKMSLALFISLLSLAAVNTAFLQGGKIKKCILLFQTAFSLVPIYISLLNISSRVLVTLDTGLNW
jgi:hypothetical protein